MTTACLHVCYSRLSLVWRDLHEAYLQKLIDVEPTDAAYEQNHENQEINYLLNQTIKSNTKTHIVLHTRHDTADLL